MSFGSITTPAELQAALALMETSFNNAASNATDPFRDTVFDQVRALYQQMRTLPPVKLSPKLSWYLGLVQRSKERKQPIEWAWAERELAETQKEPEVKERVKGKPEVSSSPFS